MALLRGGDAEWVQPSSVAITEGTHVEQPRTEVHRTDQNTDASGRKSHSSELASVPG